MTLNISTPLADKWDRVPEKYKKLVNEGKMTYQEAFKYAEEAPRTSSVQPSSRSSEERGARKSLDTTVEPAKDMSSGRFDSFGDKLSAWWNSDNARLADLYDLQKMSPEEMAAAEKEAAELEASSDISQGGDRTTMHFNAEKRAQAAALREKVAGAKKIQADPEGYAAKLAEYKGNNARAAESSQRAENYYDATGNYGARAVGDFLGNPEQVISPIAGWGGGIVGAALATPETGGLGTAPGFVAGKVAGSALGSIPMAKAAYDAAFVQAIEAGVPHDQADSFAKWMAGSEFVFEFGGGITGGASKIESGAAKQVLKSKLTEFLKRTGKESVKQGVEETATGVVQDAGVKAVAVATDGSKDTQVLSDYANKQLPTDAVDYIKRRAREAAAGAVGSAVMSAPSTAIDVHQAVEHQKVMQEFDKQQKELKASHAKTVETAKASEELKKQVDAVSEGKTPVIQDLFTSEAIPAEQVAAKAEAALAQNTAEATNPETAPTIPRSPEQQMEVDNRIVDTLKKQEAGKAKEENKTVNTLVTEELAKREQVKQAEDIVKNKYDIVNVQDIAQEANQRMKAELDAIAQSPGNRTAEGQKLLPEILARREALRLPEIKEQVKNERLAKVEQAASFLKQEEEAQVRKEVETKVAKEQAVSEPTQATLPMKYPQQPQPKARGYTGTMTPEQKVSEAKDMAFKKELASLPPEQAKVLLEETQKAEKAAVAQEKKQEKAKTAAYMAAKSNARSSIAAEVSSSMPEADAKTKAQEIGRRMLEWNTKNPEEKFVLPEVRKATTVTQKIAAKEKAKETKVSRAVAGKEQKNAEKVYEGFKKEAEASGLAPKEARAQALEKLTKHLQTTDSNEALPKEAEATLREQLKSGTTKAEAPSSKTAPSALIAANNAKVEEQFPIYHDTVDEGLNNGKQGLEDTLAYMAAATDTPDDYRKLAARLLPIVKRLNLNYERMPTSKDTKSWGGFFEPTTNTIYIGEYSHETILHETLHGVLWHILNGSGPFKNNASAKRLYEDLEKIREHMKDYINKNPSVFTKAELKYLMKYAVGPSGMLDNVDELVSYSLTKGIPQSIALKIPSSNKVKAIVDNIMDAFARAIGRMLNMESKVEQSALKDIITLTWQALDIAETSDPSMFDQAAAAAKKRVEDSKAPTTPIDSFLNKRAAQLDVEEETDSKDILDSVRSLFLKEQSSRFQEEAEPLLKQMVNIYKKYIQSGRYNNELNNAPILRIGDFLENINKIVGDLDTSPSPVQIKKINDLVSAKGPELLNDATEYLQNNPMDRDTTVRSLPVPTTLQEEESTSTEEDKPRPTLVRTGRVLTIKGRNNGIFTIKGRDIKILNHGTAENMLGVIQDALTSGHGFSANVTESLSVAQGLIGEYLQRAKARFDTIENSLKEVATKTKAPLTQVQEEFTKAVGTFEQAEGDAKTSISNSLVRNYGDAARAYFANRAEIDSLTDMIIQERLKNPEPFTSKEAAIYGKMKQELGKYYTRSYASDLKGVEETYAKSMIDAYNAKQKGTATEHQKVLAATMEAAIDTIHNTFVLIPDADVLANSSLDKLRTLAATWNLKVAENDDMSVEDKKDAFIEALDSFREDKQHLNSDFTGKRAVALATELLKDIEGSPIVSYLKGARADRTVVEARENIPPSIRKFLGEYEDVALKGLTTILKQAQFIFQTKALGEILTSEQDKGANSKILSVEEFTEKGYSTEDWKKATGESFGPLQGMYIEESLYNRLQELRDVNTPLTTFLQRDDVNPIIQAVVKSSINGWMESMSLIKQGQLVFNPVNAAYNLLGGPNILLSNGAFGKNGIKNVRKAMDTALSLIAAQGPTSVVHPEVSRMIRTNQVDSAYLGSLRGSEMDKVRDLLLAQLGETEPSLLTKGLRKSKERLTQTREIYAMMDVVWKIAAFYHRVDVLTEFDKLNGVERSPEAVDRQAAADNSLANFSYSHVPKFVKAIEKFGPSYIFPFVTESFRAPFSSMLLGISDIKRAQHALTPEAKSYLTQQGAKRALGAFTAMTTAGMIMSAGLVGMSKLIDKMQGDDDEDKDQKLIERLRPFMAPYEKFDDFFVAGKDSKGNPVLVNFNRTDPFDTVSRLTRMIAQDATADEYETYFKNLFITNKRAASLLDAVMSAGQENDGKVAKNTRMENFYRPDFIPKDWPSIYESLSSVAGPKTVKAIDGILPSWLARSMDSRNEVLAPNGTVSKALGVDVFSATVKYGGGQLTTVDINKSLKFAVIDYDKEKKAAAEQLKSILSTSEVLTKEEYAKAWVEATHQEKEAFNKLAEKFSGLQSLGYSGEEAAKYLVGAGMDKKVVHSLMQGTYRPENSLLISQASRDALKKDIEADTSPQKAKRARNYNASLEAIKEYNLPVTRSK